MKNTVSWTCAIRNELLTALGGDGPTGTLPAPGLARADVVTVTCASGRGMKKAKTVKTERKRKMRKCVFFRDR